MVTEEGKFLFKILNLPIQYNVDRDLLKKNYYSISKEVHPDISTHSSVQDIKILNRAYSTLNDDFYRAKLFTKPSSQLDSNFLEKCLELEERIHKGEDLSSELNKKIDKCKIDYSNPNSLAKWAYYRRLLDQITKK